ncbi:MULTISPECIES: hypothetical protein [unclassified Psychrobacter]|uniref:hypothetical protein n=1 Tax=unclassified Psychrobacter TaxID=196806 RepID=UPI0018F429C9|nr:MULTISPECIES: hypothetical protein [unclassified Psychrobacter]
MSLIDRLNQTVTPAILGTTATKAQTDVLEQFYAILITRLAQPEIHAQLLADTAAASGAPILFEQLWQQPDQRALLIQELAEAHHVDAKSTAQLLISAAHLGYQELKSQAQDVHLPTYLEPETANVRAYLPAWSASVLAPTVAVVNQDPTRAPTAYVYDNQPLPNATVPTGQAMNNPDVPVIVDKDTPIADEVVSSAIHASPLAHRGSEARAAVRERNQRSDLMIRLGLLAAALIALGLLWAFVYNDAPEEVAAPVVAAKPAPPPPAEPVDLTPAEVMVSVDDAGNLYSCTATVGDTNLQERLMQAVTSSFSTQSNLCNVTVQEGFATELENINASTLPEVFNVMRNTPFSRLTIQNGNVSIEAPDNVQLQQLTGNVQTLWPAATITPVAPTAAVAPPPNTYDETYNNASYNTMPSNNMPNASAPITTSNNMMTNVPQQNQQTPTVNSGAPQSNTTGINMPQQSSQPVTPQNQNNNSGNLSPEEVDDLANSSFRVDPVTINNTAQ